MMRFTGMHPSTCVVFQVGGSTEYAGINEAFLLYIAYYKDKGIGVL